MLRDADAAYFLMFEFPSALVRQFDFRFFEWGDVACGGKDSQSPPADVLLNGGVVQDVGKPPVDVANRQRIICNEALGEGWLVALASHFRFSKIIGKIGSGEFIARGPGHLGSGLVDVGDFTFRADGD